MERLLGKLMTERKKVVNRIWLVVLIVSVLFLGGCPLYITLENNKIAKDTLRKLQEVELPADTEVVDSISIAGKLIGNGNGMQYFGAVLLKTELSEEELNAYYELYRENDWSLLVEKQNSAEIEVIDRMGYQFENYGENEGNFYVLYSWGSAEGYFLGDILQEFDIRGH